MDGGGGLVSVDQRGGNHGVQLQHTAPGVAHSPSLGMLLPAWSIAGRGPGLHVVASRVEVTERTRPMNNTGLGGELRCKSDAQSEATVVDALKLLFIGQNRSPELDNSSA